MKFVAALILTVQLSVLSAFSLREKITQGKGGDYVVMSQGSLYTVLLVRSVDSSSLVLEEISAPTANLELTNFNWKTWIGNRAPGHSSWTAYRINLNNNQLEECFSYSENEWLSLDDSSHFMAKLLTLPLSKTAEEKRKRIGPPPSIGEPDYRQMWKPKVVVEGKETKNTPIISWMGKWPKDSTLISECFIELYFGNFTFPYWIDIKTSHYTVSLRSVDSGTDLSSPMPPLPQKPPEVTLGREWIDPKAFIREKK